MYIPLLCYVYLYFSSNIKIISVVLLLLCPQLWLVKVYEIKFYLGVICVNVSKLFSINLPKDNCVFCKFIISSARACEAKLLPGFSQVINICWLSV